ncbi:HAD-superfamily hydrolase, subfamily IA,variant 3 [Tepidanaerobacter acetatoxydans Re1]|uniref:HAD-superfamily hydrolase, subfamily IA,variant 3 n=1 Tax=Tepidanaerobacter acetatoxydans (strain DSM 21804 / JCM 16047 / Re1) TaxID=1209989 RepID=F4LWR2_TEPAE|nr:HAD family hydrolase [Tepidanaerobacter acetatoxydans]AEE91784.1 HAD-superfamily hydrolase, subfamily IA, variant 3 [Tepidanaerobacter acetatoxydans Re1]CCP26568.1 HAD-superfamily hydrolase, subfamily IA,variant 3 [Tepidanaerobacter acetatoxydans Re1]
MKYKAIIFDLDGTLLDTLEDLANSMNQVLKSQGLPIHEIEKYKQFVGSGMYNLALRALPLDKRDESFIKHCQNLMQEEYKKRWADTTKPYEGIPELLDRLTTLGCKKAVLSNKPHEFTQLIVKKLLERWSFDAVFGERPGVPRKPNPAGALEIAKLLDIPPKEFIYLGDSGIDMNTAKSAGMYAVGVLWGFRDADELMENGADLIIKTPIELFSVIE